MSHRIAKRLLGETMTDESEQTDAILAAYKEEHANFIVAFFIMAKIIGDLTDEKPVEYIITKRSTVDAEKSKCGEKSGVFEFADAISPVRSQNFHPHEFIGGFQRTPIASAHGEADKMEGSRSREAKPGLIPSRCWNRSHRVIRSLCSCATELVADAFAFGPGCFGSCSHAGGPNGAAYQNSVFAIS
jgi:hypothetical protein